MVSVFPPRRSRERVVTGPADAVLGDAALLRSARLGPAWAPAVHRLLDRLDPPAPERPRTAAELHDLLDGVPSHAGSTGAAAP